MNPSPHPSPSTPRAEATLSNIHELVEVHLQRVDQRYTAGRQAVVSLLATFGRPISIADLSSAIPDVPRSSAYRHLADLESAGIVRRIASGDEFARFELAEDLTHHHHHLLCSSCGKVIDVTPSHEFERVVSSMVATLSANENFLVMSHTLDVIGHCSSCQ